MQIELFDHLLLLASVVCAASLVRLFQRREGIGLAYALWVGVGLLMSVFSMGGDRFVGTVAVSLVFATVVVPWLLEHASRWAFARGKLVWVARASGLRASLMPGSGLDRQLSILDGLALLEREGVDAALAHFRSLANEAEEGDELAMIQEQIVSMLFHSERWDEGIAYYERRFRLGYAALRPALALGLLRAYGESGQLETAAGLLRELEEGPVGRDPKTAELLGQARLTFLAYAGAVGPVDEVVQRERFGDLGLTQATAELFKGIAQTRAGAAQAAVETLSKVAQLAGPDDQRVEEAAQTLLARARAAMSTVAADPELPEELRAYVDVVAERLRDFLQVAAPMRRSGRPVATYTIIVVLSLVYGIHLLRGGGGIGLLEVGGLSEDLWRGGSWARVFSSAWVHIDLVALLFDVYAIWLAGQIVERVLGRSRMVLASVGAAVAGMTASVLGLPLLWEMGWSSLAVVAPTGANLMAVGAVVAGLWLLLPRFTPPLEPRMRRNLSATLALLLLANLLTGWPQVEGVGAGLAPLGLLVTIFVASLCVWGLPMSVPRWAQACLATVVGVLALSNLAAFGLVFAEQPEAYLVEHREQQCTMQGARVQTPIDYAPVSLDRSGPYLVPVIDGVVDGLELRNGGLIQIGVGPAPVEADRLALFDAIEGLEYELSVTAAGQLPAAYAERIEADASWRAVDLWRNGERVARLVERRLDPGAGVEPAVLYLLASPAEAIEHGAAIHAAILAEATLDADLERSARTRCEVK